jgi:hypothetical protein
MKNDEQRILLSKLGISNHYLSFGCTVPMIADHEISLTGEHMYHSGFERS